MFLKIKGIFFYQQFTKIYIALMPILKYNLNIMLASLNRKILNLIRKMKELSLIKLIFNHLHFNLKSQTFFVFFQLFVILTPALFNIW